MTTSGTVDATSTDLMTIIELAWRRTRQAQQTLTSEKMYYARTNLELFLEELITRGLQLWVIERRIIPMYVGNELYTIQDGAQDVTNAYRRTPTRLTVDSWATSDGGDTSYLDDDDFSTICVQTAPGGYVEATFADAVGVRHIGILPGSSASGVNLTFQASSDGGATWKTVQTVSGATFVDSQWMWYDVPNTLSGTLFRVQADASYTIDFRELFLSSSSREVTITRMNRDDYSALPDKFLQGTPTNFYEARLADRLEINLWPVPVAKYDEMVLWVRRLTQDVGGVYTYTIEVPKRWLNAIIDGLAYRIGKEEPTVDVSLLPILKSDSDLSLKFAEGEEVDRGPIRIGPNIRGYTR